jgi:hypothetical protein
LGLHHGSRITHEGTSEAINHLRIPHQGHHLKKENVRTMVLHHMSNHRSSIHKNSSHLASRKWMRWLLRVKGLLKK